MIPHHGMSILWGVIDISETPMQLRIHVLFRRHAEPLFRQRCEGEPSATSLTFGPDLMTFLGLDKKRVGQVENAELCYRQQICRACDCRLSSLSSRIVKMIVVRASQLEARWILWSAKVSLIR